MPATRASSKQPNRHDPVTEAQRNKRKSPRRSPSDVILLSSSSDEEMPRSKRSPKKNSKPPQPNEVIEISDDEDSVAPPPPRPSKKEMQVRELRLQLDQLRDTNGRLEKDLDHAKAKLEEAQSSKDQLAEEVAVLKQLREPSKTKFLDPSELEDSVTCEICTMKMWKPYILPECGHSFCESCLQDWFSTALARHAQAHPGYDVNRPQTQFPAYMIQMHPQLHQMLAMYDQANPQPEYTCPTCRVRVRTRPIEDYSLKAIVRTVAQAQGESSPRKPTHATSSHGRKGKNRPPQTQPSPWDAYFPRAA